MPKSLLYVLAERLNKCYQQAISIKSRRILVNQKPASYIKNRAFGLIVSPSAGTKNKNNEAKVSDIPQHLSIPHCFLEDGLLGCNENLGKKTCYKKSTKVVSLLYPKKILLFLALARASYF